eukprot:124307-Rhodomonas_salina.1
MRRGRCTIRMREPDTRQSEARGLRETWVESTRATGSINAEHTCNRIASRQLQEEDHAGAAHTRVDVSGKEDGQRVRVCGVS